MKLSKLHLICLLLFISATLRLQAQTNYLSFKSLDDMPYISEWPATVTDGSRIYAINAYSTDNYSQDVLMYDPAKSDTWSVYNNNAGEKSQASAAYIASSNRIYVFGGYYFSSHKIFSGVQCIDLNSHEIKTLGIHNPIATMSGWAAEWQGLIYIFGGTPANNLTTNNLYSFNPETNQFKQLANMPDHVQTAGAIVNGVLYTFGGFNEVYKEQTDHINAYDIKTDKWETIAKLPQTVSANSVAAFGDLIFVAGDYNNETFLGYFNTTTRKFTQLKSNMTGHRAGGLAVVGDLLYVFGGKTDPGQPTGGFKTVQVADLSIFGLEAHQSPQAKPANAKPAKKV